MKERIIRFGLPALAVATSIGIGFAGITSAQSAPAAQNGAQAPHERTMGERPAVVGKITAISGTTLTVSSAGMRGDSSSATTYTVDASAAKIVKGSVGAAPSEATVSSLAVGDTVAVDGTLSGTSVVATKVMDGFRGPGFMRGRGPGQGTIGTVTAINGSTITLSGKDGATYTIDASAAKIGKMTTISAADIKIGDILGVHGTTSGTAITAQDIMDGLPPAFGQK
jgi:hypothetical protein